MTAKLRPSCLAASSLVCCALAVSVALAPPTVAAQAGAGEPVVLSHRDKLYDITAHGAVALAVGYPGLVLAIEERGDRVRKLDVHTREALFAIALDAASNQGAIVGRNCTVLTSSDAGTSWQSVTAQVASACNGAALLDVAVLPSGRVVAVGELGTIVTSDDHGKTWQRRTFDFTLPEPPAAGAPDAANAAPAADLSAEEENEGAIEEARLSSVVFADAHKGFAVGEFGLVLSTTDGGASWKRQNSGTGKLLFSVDAWSPSHALAVGAEGALVETTDGGETWSVHTADDSEALLGVTSVESGCVIVGTHGLVLWRGSPQDAFVRRPTHVYTWLEAAEFLDAVTGFFVGGRGHLLRTRDGGKHFERVLGQ